jgi:two-component system, NtrC family, sensor histidine kinase HydH
MASPTRILGFSLPALSLPWRRPSTPAKPFDLRSWFAVVGLVAIAALSIFAAMLLSRFLTERMLRQEAVLTMQFVQSVVLVEKPERVFAGGADSASDSTREAFEHIARMPDVIRANLYSAQRRLVWSSDHSLIGKQFENNPELDRSLAGELTVNEEDPEEEAAHPKAEHVNLDPGANYFVEIYIPVWDSKHTRVAGDVELYKNPRALFDALQAGKRLIWAGALAGGLFLFLALFSMIRRADNLIRHQQERLVESERLAAVGELGSAVAHSIRNPLTAIRSSAELALEGDPDLSRESARDIMAEVDRLEQWVRELLSYSRPVAGKLSTIEVLPVLLRCSTQYAREMDKRGIRCVVDLPPTLPAIQGDPLLLAQVVNSLIANAIEAIQGDGPRENATVSISAAAEGKRVQVTIADNGPGMSAEQRQRAFKPFFTTKSKGLGVGLPLAKRIIERFAGSISISSEPGMGTSVLLQFHSIE